MIARDARSSDEMRDGERETERVTQYTDKQCVHNGLSIAKSSLTIKGKIETHVDNRGQW